MATIRLRDSQKQTVAYNHPSGLVVLVTIIRHHINKRSLSADRFNRSAPIIQTLITGSNRRGAGPVYRPNSLRAPLAEPSQRVLFGDANCLKAGV